MFDAAGAPAAISEPDSRVITIHFHLTMIVFMACFRRPPSRGRPHLPLQIVKLQNYTGRMHGVRPGKRETTSRKPRPPKEAAALRHERPSMSRDQFADRLNLWRLLPSTETKLRLWLVSGSESHGLAHLRILFFALHQIRS